MKRKNIIILQIVQNLFDYLNDGPVWEILVDLFSEMALKIKSEDTVKLAKYGGYADPDFCFVWGEDPFYQFNGVLKDEIELSDELFKRYFSALYMLLGKGDFMKDNVAQGYLPLYARDFIRAWELGILTDNQLLHELLGRPCSHYLMRYMSRRLCKTNNPKAYLFKEIKPLPANLKILVEKALSRIMEIELKRGSTPTDVSFIAKELDYVGGIDNFIGILEALGNEKFIKWSYQDSESKKEVMSSLLRVCFPADNDSGAILRKKAEESKISAVRLVEAAMYAPQWLELVEEAIGWDGLTSAAYYFLAHTGDCLGKEVKSRVSRYTMVDPDDFADGAFDPDWFHEVYETLGEERYNIVYDAAKYVSDSNRHTRARKLSDASLGNYAVQELMGEISAKRNRDLVVALGLIPLGDNREEDIEERYAFLNKFLKEGKQFGAQRQASEKRAVKLALDNLARTAGYADSTRLTWNMEAKLVERLSDYLVPKELDGVTLHIEISEGMPEIVMESKGKKLQNIPAKLKKDSYMVGLKEAYQSLKDQHVRGRALLENSMTDLSEFIGREVRELRDNPIIWNMLRRLVLIKEDGAMGFLGDDGDSLITIDGGEMNILPSDTLRIVHPYDLYQSGRWSEYQKLLFDKQWRQPFKQVFRELYIPTEDEKELTHSTRYSGNQIMPQRTVGVLKKRQWTADYEKGLQKTVFRHNLIAQLYAMADWFSPADIEAPTLEYVAFYDRRTGKEKPILEINPIVFSEIMRDVDLVVSVAHAGGVDPEASHSTMEMRKVIAEHSILLFGLGNVKVCGNFVKVKGELADYNIHLGSGVVHQEGGAEIAVLPVHSQSRGRIFLPFVDEDPKTAEIISKILLFAEDTKIKDPAILNQISRKP